MHIYKLSGRNVEVTDAMRDYVEEKLTRLDRFNDQITDARVTLTVRDVRDAGRRNRVEVQLNVPSGIIRAEEHHSDMYAAIDKASDVLERQLRKFKTDELREGLALVAAEYHKVVVSLQDGVEPAIYERAMHDVYDAISAMSLNVNETLLLHALFAKCPSLHMIAGRRDLIEA